MEEEGRYSCCCSGAEAGLHRQDVLIRLLLQRESRQQRLARGFAAALLLLVSGALALFVTLLLGGRGRPAADSQPMVQPYRHSSGFSAHQQDFKNPSAMLTAPAGNNVNGKYLEWERDDGHAFCHGGFNYSSGSLMVPRMGIYRVFLQITYESRNNLERDDELRLTNSVFLFRDGYMSDAPLLSSLDSVSSTMKQWSKTLYTAGLFSLEAGSSLHVTSSHPDLIVVSESKVFFGAELLS